MSGINHKFLNSNLLSSSSDGFRSTAGGYWSLDYVDETAISPVFIQLGDGSTVQEFNGIDGGRFIDTEFIERIVTDINLATTSSGELVIPSIKFPVRIIGNEDNITADEQWKAIVAGGSYSTSSYGAILVNGDFLDINFTYDAPYAPIYIKENDYNNIGNYTLANFTYDYNSYIEEYQLFVNDLQSYKSIPNYYFLLSHYLGYSELENETVNLFVAADGTIDTNRIFSQKATEYPPTYDIDSSDIKPGELVYFDKKSNIESYLSDSFINSPFSINDEISNLSSNLFFNKKSQQNLFLESLDFIELMPYYTKINLPYESGESTTFFDMIENADCENIMLNYIKNYFVDNRESITTNENFTTLISKLTSSNADVSIPTIMTSSTLNYADFYDIAFNSIIEANNPKANNFYILGGQDIDREQIINSDGIYRYKSSISGLKLLEQLNNYVETDSIFTSDIENIEDFFNLSETEKYSETMAYRIEKVPFDEPSNVQNFYVSNTQTGLRSTSNRDGITIYDSQIKYNTEYTYNAFAYVLVYGYAYSYSDLVLTKIISIKDLDIDELADLGADILEQSYDNAYCLEFYDPATGETSNRLVLNDDSQFLTDTTTVEYEAIDDPISGATFRVEELGDALLESYLLAGQEIYTLTEEIEGVLDVGLLSTAQLASYKKYLADFNFSIQPTIKLVEVPIYTKTINVLDHPPPMLDITPFQRFDDSQTIGFLANADPFVQKEVPQFTTGYYDVNNVFKTDYRDKYLESNDLIGTDLVSNPSRSRMTSIQIFRKSEMPSNELNFSYEDLQNSFNLVVGNTSFSNLNQVIEDQISTNSKFYYILRLVNENGVNGPPTRFIEAELVNDGGYKYSLFKELIESDYPVELEKEPKLENLKKLFELVPNINQIQFDTSNVDFDNPAAIERENIIVGTKEDSIFDKTFKIRLTSKKTGKIIDLNVTYKLKDGS